MQSRDLGGDRNLRSQSIDSREEMQFTAPAAAPNGAPAAVDIIYHLHKDFSREEMQFTAPAAATPAPAAVDIIYHLHKDFFSAEEITKCFQQGSLVREFEHAPISCEGSIQSIQHVFRGGHGQNRAILDLTVFPDRAVATFSRFGGAGNSGNSDNEPARKLFKNNFFDCIAQVQGD
jgi:hypothetical protein